MGNLNERFVGYLKYGSLLDYWVKKETPTFAGILAAIITLLVGAVIAIVCCCKRKSMSQHGEYFLYIDILFK